MQINIQVDQPPLDERSSGPVSVGWYLDSNKGSVLFDAPERVITRAPNRSHGKSVGRCPAAVNIESRYFQIKCPFDIHVQLVRDEKGRPVLKDLAGPTSSIRQNKLGQVLSIVSEAEWRYPDRPTLQLVLPYMFIADEPVYISQVPPFFHYRAEPWPGTQFCGRFPIHVWPRPLMWAFEWHDIRKPLQLSRGEPLFYVTFETLPQERAVQLVQAEVTPELLAYVEAISGVTNYVNQTFSLFKTAEERRPARLLKPKQ
nr:hypothetical protein [uncultured Gellertiella sp.]